MEADLYEQVIVGYDGSDGAEDALALGRMVSGATGAVLVLARVFPFDVVVAEHRSGRTPPAVALLELEIQAVADGLRSVAEPLSAEVSAVPNRSVSRGLEELAEERHADLIIVGSSSRASLGRVFAGNVGDSLLRQAPCPVAIAPRGFRDRGEGPPRVVGVAFDGSPNAERALAAASALAGRAEATMRLIAAAPPAAAAQSRQQLAERLDRARDQLPSELRAAALLVEGPPVPAILEELERGIHVLFIGSRGFGPIRKSLMGSVSAALVRSALCPVIVVPPTAEDHPDEARGARGAKLTRRGGRPASESD